MVDNGAAVQAYYARDKERDRLAVGVGRVEYARTVEIVGRTLPPPPAVVADIGGGPGRYTDWLADAGYRVVHRDIVAHHVEQVRSRHGSAVDTAVGDARALDLPDACVDAVLLFGPLYHLPEADDRVQALREAWRVVRPGGAVHAAAISRWAVRMDGILVQRFHETHPVLRDKIDEMERTGWLQPIAEAGFTGYAHTPDQLRQEVGASGLSLQSLIALEGISFALADIDERMDDPVQRDLVLDSLRALESVPDLIGLGTHLLATARRRVDTRGAA
jgi:SAM-dependent methyltransferase